MTQRNHAGRSPEGAIRGLPGRESVITALMESPSFSLFAARVVAFGITFMVPLILVRLLTIEEFGLYKQAFLLHSTLFVILQFGLPASLLYFAVHDQEARPAYVLQTIILLTALAILGSGLLFGLAWWGPRAFSLSTLRPFIPLLSGLLAVSLLASPFEPLLLATRAFRLAAGVHLGFEAFRALLMTAAAGLVGGVSSILIASIVWGGARCLGMGVCLAKFGIALPRRLDPETLGRQCNYALPYALGVIALTCAEGVHLYVVAFSFPLAVFAIYSVGVLQIPLTDLAFHSLADVALVHLTELAQEHRFRDMRARISRTAGQLVTLLVPFYVWLALNADGLIRTLYTDRFAASIPIFQISLLTIPLTAVAVDYVPRAFADTPFLLAVNTFRLFLALALVIPLVAILGPLGAAIGTVATLALTRAVMMVRVSRLTRTTLFSLLPWGHLLRVGLAFPGVPI